MIGAMSQRAPEPSVIAQENAMKAEFGGRRSQVGHDHRRRMSVLLTRAASVR
jgi:hypothetical protein